MPTLDPTEAPPGMVAVLKSEFIRPPNEPANWCHHCHHRPNCDGVTRCGPGVVVRLDGSRADRKDGCSVIFRRTTEQSSAVG